MTRMRKTVGLVLCSVSALAAASCGDVVRQGRAPMFLIIDDLAAAAGRPSGQQFGSMLYSDVITNVTTPEPCKPESPCPTVFSDVGRVTLRIAPKDVTSATAPTTNNDVTINRFHVTYKRADGRNTPGIDVPYGFDGAATATVTTAGTTLGFEIVRHAAKEESPLVQLKANPGIITTIADVTFYGRDQVGNDVSVTGSLQIDFGNFGDF
jgi:hypothetical protein